MKTTLIVMFGLFLTSSVALGQGAALKVGDKAPDFVIAAKGTAESPDKDLKVSCFAGKKAVLVAFYPKVFTPGCTTQMCGYRDDSAEFRDAGVEVVAVSMDAQTESDRFKKEKELPFHVVGDPKGDIVSAYGVPTKEIAAGKVAQRSVFLIDTSGVIQYIDLNYSVSDGKKSLYDAIKKLATHGDK